MIQTDKNSEKILEIIKDYKNRNNKELETAMDFLKENKVKILHGEEARRLLDKDVVHLYWGDDREAGWIAWKKDPRVNESYPNGFNPHEWEKE